MRLARIVLLAVTTLCVVASATDAPIEHSAATPGYEIRWPRDEGSHPTFRTEWWYLTGWLEDDSGKSYGFQVTFFRHRPGTDEANPSRFAAKQLLFAHASLSDAARGRLLRDEKIARAGFGLAEAREDRMDVHIDDWRLQRTAEESIKAEIAAASFRFELDLTADQQPLLQGQQGFSQKGPSPSSASYYYSVPQLRAQGRVVVEGKSRPVRGSAWLDHEWFSLLLDSDARGWDWAGLNLEDGSALMVFRTRDTRNEQHWAAATYRERSGRVVTYPREAIRWEAGRHWRSSRTGVDYPVEWQIQIGERTIALRPLLDDQENDARGSTGTLYWEGAVRAYDVDGKYIGRGYLELTGYGDRITF